jgi:DNA repair protein RadC
MARGQDDLLRQLETLARSVQPAPVPSAPLPAVLPPAASMPTAALPAALPPTTARPTTLLRARPRPALPVAMPAQPVPPQPDFVPGSPMSAEGHRARMRARLLQAGPDSVADHELLEMVLFLALPRRDTKPIARALLTRFGSFANAVSAPLPDLRGIEGLGDAGLAALKTIQAAALRLVRSEVLNLPVLNNWDRLMEYLQAAIGRERVEQFRILFLDNRNRLLADEAQARGTVNHTPVYPREVVKRALELHATALILVHNHPSGDPSPSREDVEMTRLIGQAASALSVTLHDHVIVGNGRWFSFRREGML